MDYSIGDYVIFNLFSGNDHTPGRIHYINASGDDSIQYHIEHFRYGYGMILVTSPMVIVRKMSDEEILMNRLSGKLNNS